MMVRNSIEETVAIISKIFGRVLKSTIKNGVDNIQWKEQVSFR